ncbi:MAG: DUF4184 family protein [Chitinivibrionales bacterium]|nr:DUF4184 family protein [Chitinivibrionales bacterium]
MRVINPSLTTYSISATIHARKPRKPETPRCMPITVSHAAAAIPLRRLRLPPSAVIVGSMAPDFEFFLRLSDKRVGAHTLPGLFLFCVPVGLAALLLFHKLLKYPLLSLLPHSHQKRLYRPAQSFRFFPLRRFVLVVAGLLVGTASHLLWDSWTHHDGWFVLLLPALRKAVLTVGSGTLRVYDVLQHVSSAGGILLLALAYHSWYRRAAATTIAHGPPAHPLAKATVGAGMVCVALLAGFAHAAVNTSFERTIAFIAQSSVTTVTAFFGAWAIYSLIWVWRLRGSGRLVDESDIEMEAEARRFSERAAS